MQFFKDLQTERMALANKKLRARSESFALASIGAASNVWSWACLLTGIVVFSRGY